MFHREGAFLEDTCFWVVLKEQRDIIIFLGLFFETHPCLLLWSETSGLGQSLLEEIPPMNVPVWSTPN